MSNPVKMGKSTKYNAPMRVMHWVVALVVIATLFMGYMMTNVIEEPLKFTLYPKHKALGITVGALMMLRIVVRYLSAMPPALFSKFENVAMCIVHFLLYFLTFGAVLSGYFMSCASGKVIDWFGLFKLVCLVDYDPGFASIAHTMHGVIVYSLLCTVCIHVLAGFKHLIVDRKNIFKRMI